MATDHPLLWQVMKLGLRLNAPDEYEQMFGSLFGPQTTLIDTPKLKIAVTTLQVRVRVHPTLAAHRSLP